MVITAFPAVSAGAAASPADGELMMNDNQGDGVILTKIARPHLVNGVPDGTVDIVINAMTTGTVTNTTTVVPADIVLVLDVSGSMDDTDTHTTTAYTEVYGTSYGGGSYYNPQTFYGFNSARAEYYIQLADGTWQSVQRSEPDDNNYYYYRYRSGGSWIRPTYTYVYPVLDGSAANPDRAESYPVVQFYERTVTTTTSEKKIDQLKSAVSAFIDAAVESNAGIENPADRHRISVIKFADNSYYNGRGATQDDNAAVNGNDTFREGGNTYNYTQIVTDLITADASGAAALKAAVNGLQPGGATAVDYGLQLAEHALFDKRSAADIAGRHEIVVVFSDGSPTHSSDYSSSVAANAVNNAYALKSKGVEVYSISVAAGADASNLGTDQTNQFMHYISSNYPDAQASGGTIVPGTGSPASGYYWVPSGTLTLDAIFESVMSEIGAPTIALGTDAAVIDTVSPYFTLPGGLQSVALFTSDKTADGWTAEVPGTGLTPVLTGNTLHVEGFDFDANYISSTPRDGGFYGRMLVIRMNVLPDYATVDARTAEITAAGGIVHTNLGTAAIVDSEQNAVAVVNSPSISLNTVTYMLDGRVYAIYYRLPGAGVTVLPKIADTDTHTYTDWTTADVTVTDRAFTMPSGDVVLHAASTALEYTVTYEYRAPVPAGAPALPPAADYKAGDTVTVAPAPSVPGYVFSGWQSVEVVPANGQFTMPARNVTLVGSFAPSDTVAYKVEHYLQNTDGTYPAEPTNFHYHYDGTTGETVTAIIMDYPQFTYDPAISTPSGVVLADGSLVLKLYYARNPHTVTYKYDDPVPAGAPAVPAAETHRTGAVVTVADVPTLAGYTFIGWASDGQDVILVSSNTDVTFLMPDRDVVLHGFFLKNGDTAYTVEHYLETDTDGVYAEKPAMITEHAGETDAEVVGVPQSFEGYSYNAEKSAPTASGKIKGDGTLVLKLYYDKVPYTVSYRYTGTVPENAPALPIPASYHMGDTVTVAPVPTLAGYTFTGWTAGSVTADENGQFIMPDEDVVFTGFFSRNEAKYTVSHYFQLEDGTYGEPQVTYTVDSHEGETVTAEYLTVSGYTPNTAHPDTKTEGTVLIDGSLTLKLFYARGAYTVTYVYENTVPGATPLPPAATVLHGASVTVAPAAAAPGYTFVGWVSEQVDASAGRFTMPQTNVVLKGRFVADTDTPYRVEHYKELPGGGYGSTPDDTDYGTGTTGYTVTAGLKHYEGFTPAANNVLTGVITAAPDTLVIKLYYIRNSYNVYYRYSGVQPEGAPDISVHDIARVPYGTEVKLADKPTLEKHTFDGWNSISVELGADSFVMPARDVIITGTFVEYPKMTVTYEYEGTVPAGAPALPAAASYYEGDPVTVAPNPTLTGYTFSGWVSEQVTPDAGKFVMPAVNVVFKGEFLPGTGTAYRVEHYKQNLDGTYPANPSDSETLAGTTGTEVTARPKTYTGFTEDTDYAGRIAFGTVLPDGSLTLKLYYERNSYSVTYRYTGTVPTGATAAPETRFYKYGEQVAVEPAGMAPGHYTFVGWNSSDVTPVNGVFVMPASDVLFTGFFETVVTTGHIRIEKTLQAPADFTGPRTFSFTVFRVQGSTGVPVASVTVPAGSTASVELNPGTYIVTEEECKVDGYTHSVLTSAPGGLVTVSVGGTSVIRFANTYVKAELEKDDHFGYIIGYPDGTVRPESNITRAEIATIFFRMLTDESRAAVWSQTNSFTDVYGSDWYNNAISTLANAGVLNGYEDGTFRPNGYITRAELVKIAAAFYGTEAGADTAFADTSEHWANDFIAAAREMGFVDGYEDGTFRPDQYVTRAEAMKIINRTLDRHPDKDHLHRDMIVWPDNADDTAWYYAEVQEATNSHVYKWDSVREIWIAVTGIRDWAALEKEWSTAYGG